MKMVQRRRYVEDEDSGVYVPISYKNENRSKVHTILLTVAILALVCGSMFLAATSNIELNNLQSKVKMMQEQSSKMESRLKRSLENTRSMVETNSNVHHMQKRQAENAERNREVAPVQQSPVITGYGGATFIRWGRRDCPPKTSQIIYQGYAAGSHHTHTGGVSDYMCLHSNITYTPGKYVNAHQSSSYIYGLEFRDAAWVYQLFDLSLIEIGTLQFHSVPCAMCLAPAQTQLVIPGREECPSGWTKQYVGYIMSAGHSDKHATSPLCVDEKPQVVPGTEGNQQGASLFMVETSCTSLLCEPYVAGREVRCVVCTI